MDIPVYLALAILNSRGVSADIGLSVSDATSSSLENPGSFPINPP